MNEYAGFARETDQERLDRRYGVGAFEADETVAQRVASEIEAADDARRQDRRQAHGQALRTEDYNVEKILVAYSELTYADPMALIFRVSEITEIAPDDVRRIVKSLVSEGRI